MDLFSQDPLADSLLPVLEVIAAEIEEAIIGAACLAGDGMVDGLDVDMYLQMQILLAELSQEDIAAALSCREEERDCADFCLRDWVIGNYFNLSQPFERVVGGSLDEETGYVHFSPVAVVGLYDIALGVVG